METSTVVVAGRSTADVLPVGRVEFARAGSRVYGVDAVGSVFLVTPVVARDSRVFRRFIRAVFGAPLHFEPVAS